MAEKPKDANRTITPLSVGFDEKSFFEGILKDDYILVIGSGVILDPKKYPLSKGDINHHIINNISNKRGKQYRSFSEIILDTPITEESPIHDEILNGLNYSYDEMSIELRNLLKSKHFKFVFTTTSDHYIENFMRGIWDNDLRVVNISNEGSLNDFEDALARDFIHNYSQPTLFYVFGKASKKENRNRNKKFLQSDTDAIEYIIRWIQLENRNNNHIIQFLKSKRLMGLGCNFEDWYYRFFWYILTRGFNRSAAGEPYRNDNVVLDFHQQKLKNYLSSIDVCLHDDSLSMMKYIAHLLNADQGNISYKELINSKKLEGKVFLSYKNNPDYTIALNLFRELTSRCKSRIWFDDSSLLGGQSYNQHIPEAIRYSQVFIPILTKTVSEILKKLDINKLSDLKKKGELPYFIQEWIWASEVNELVIIPVAFTGYDLRGTEHEKFEMILYGSKTNNRPSGIQFNNEVSFDEDCINKLLISIKYALGVYE